MSTTTYAVRAVDRVHGAPLGLSSGLCPGIPVGTVLLTGGPLVAPVADRSGGELRPRPADLGGRVPQGSAPRERDGSNASFAGHLATPEGADLGALRPSSSSGTPVPGTGSSATAP